MKKIYVISVIILLVFLLSVVIVQNYNDKIEENNYYVDAMIASPVEAINYEYDGYVMHMPKEYTISKEPDSITYVISNDDVIMTIDNTVKMTTDNYLAENNVDYLYEYNTEIDEVNYMITTWKSLEYENYIDVYFTNDQVGALAIIPNDTNVEENLNDLISILKSISKQEGEE